MQWSEKIPIIYTMIIYQQNVLQKEQVFLMIRIEFTREIIVKQ